MAKLSYLTMPSISAVLLYNEAIETPFAGPVLEIPILFGDVATAEQIAEALIACEGA